MPRKPKMPWVEVTAVHRHPDTKSVVNASTTVHGYVPAPCWELMQAVRRAWMEQHPEVKR